MSVHFNSEIRENKGQNIIAGINKEGIGKKVKEMKGYKGENTGKKWRKFEKRKLTNESRFRRRIKRCFVSPLLRIETYFSIASY